METGAGTTEKAAERYLRECAGCCERSRTEFLAKRPRTRQLIDATNELVASLIYFLVEKDLDHVPNGIYIVDLLVSFCRSHFVAMDLVSHGQIIESATIVRKQMEVVSRLKELAAGMGIAELTNKTPNVKRLPAHFKRLYGEYSTIAHSSSPKKIRLLGVAKKDGARRTPLYPMFDDNLYVTLLHIILVAMEFAFWVRAFYRAQIKSYNGAADRVLLDDLVRLVVAEYPIE